LANPCRRWRIFGGGLMQPSVAVQGLERAAAGESPVDGTKCPGSRRQCAAAISRRRGRRGQVRPWGRAPSSLMHQHQQPWPRRSPVTSVCFPSPQPRPVWRRDSKRGSARDLAGDRLHRWNRTSPAKGAVAGESGAAKEGRGCSRRGRRRSSEPARGRVGRGVIGRWFRRDGRTGEKNEEHATGLIHCPRAS